MKETENSEKEKKAINQLSEADSFNMKEEGMQLLWHSFLDEVLPRVRRFIPFLRKKLMKDNDFLAPGEIIVIGKDDLGDFVVLKFNSEHGEVRMPEDPTKRDVDDIDSLLLKLFKARV